MADHTGPHAGLAVISHRANGGEYPENTLLGIDAALRDAVDAIEIDVRATSDGTLVLLHDADLARVAGVRRPVASMSRDDLGALRVRDPRGAQPPQPIPTLEETFAAIDGRAAIVVDFVDDSLPEPIIDAVRKAGAEAWTWFTPHHPRVAMRLREACPAARVFLGWTHDEGHSHASADAVSLAERLGLAGIMANHRAVDRTTVDYAHSRGLAVACWTVNDPPRMASLARLGVDAITTDYPSRLLGVMRHLGIPRLARLAPRTTEASR